MGRSKKSTKGSAKGKNKAAVDQNGVQKEARVIDDHQNGGRSPTVSDGSTQQRAAAHHNKGNPNTEIPFKKKRIYVARESLLTKLCANDKNIEALYHVLILMILVGLGYSLLKDTVEAGRPHIDLRYYVSGFGPFDMQLLSGGVWLCLQVAALSVYFSFKVWQYCRPLGRAVVDVFFIALFLVYTLLANYFVISAFYRFNLFPVPSLVLMVEQLRFSMKSYSFIRENAYKVLYPWHKDDTSGPAVWYRGQMSPTVGSFSQYCYFLFAPTLLYRDHYPRTPRIHWLRVCGYLIKCCITIAFITVLTKEIFSLYPNNLQNVMFSFLSCCLWGLLYQFMAGYFFLHSFLNMFSELFTFADREFYSDWWTCNNFHLFYRKWNLIVHDWIKAYIYSDLKDFMNSDWYNKIAFFPPIIISGLFHEYVLYAPVRFILPVLLFMFGAFGSILYIVRPSPNSKLWNFILHFGLHFGVSIMVFCYSMEYYSRMFCPREETFIDAFIPRFYECYTTLFQNDTKMG